jgi:hypothetical protein
MFLFGLALVLVLAFVFERSSALRRSRRLWERTLDRMKEPSERKTIWNKYPCNFCIVLVEFRKHPWMPSVLKNLAHVYGGSTAGLCIVHGRENADFVRDLVRGWSNVKTIALDYDNISIDTYNNILTRPSFWDLFESEHVLVTQTDCLMRKRIPKEFFSYDYVGAPWWFSPTLFKYPHPRKVYVGNGGLSLRRVDVMKRICERHSRQGMPEDVFFAIHCENVPTAEKAAEFSVESVYHSDPCGMHKAYDNLRPATIRRLLKNVF